MIEFNQSKPPIIGIDWIRFRAFHWIELDDTFKNRPSVGSIIFSHIGRILIDNYPL